MDRPTDPMMDPERYGLLPMRCYTCKKPIAHFQIPMEEWIEAGGDLQGFYDYYGVELSKRPQLDKWLDEETKEIERTTNQLVTLLTQTHPQYLNQFKEKFKRIPWDDKTYTEGGKPLAFTLERRFREWMHGNPPTQAVIMKFVDVLERYYLAGIYDALKVPKKDRPIVTERLRYGLGARGFQIKHGLDGFRMCCRTNIRPPPKIL